MIADIRKLLDNRPFVPFTLHSIDGAEIPVPTIDHISISVPHGNRIVVWFDNDDYTVIRSTFIIRISSQNGKE